MITAHFFKKGFFIRVPGENVLILGSTKDAFNSDDGFQRQEEDEHSFFYRNDFFLKDLNPVFFCEKKIRVSLSDFLSFLVQYEKSKDKNGSAIADNRSNASLFFPNEKEWLIQKKRYNSFFSDLFSLFKTTALKKAVPYATFESNYPISEQDIPCLIRRALEQPDGYAYGFWNENEGVIGVSPEILFQKKNHRVLSYAVAGTVSQSQIKKLESDVKINQEQEYVALFLKERLEDLGEVHVTDKIMLPFQNLVHLKNELSVELKEDISFSKLVEHLHPTPAVGTSPFSFLSLLHAHDTNPFMRKYYAAPFGYQTSEKDSFCLVAIRHVSWNQSCSYIQVGGGITKDSVLSDEWKEILLKFETVKTMFFGA